MTDVLLQEDTDGVRVLTLNRPGARNALSTELAGALQAALSAADADVTEVVPHDQGLEKRRLDVMARNRAQIGGGQA
jgi:hypothetical protein